MRVVNYEITRIVPLQLFGVSEERLGMLAAMYDNGEVQLPVCLIEHRDDTRGEVGLLVDGTHRTYNACSLGRPNIEAVVLDTDQEWIAGAPSKFAQVCPTLQQVREFYELSWKHEMLRLGIRMVTDLPVFPGSREELFAMHSRD